VVIEKNILEQVSFIETLIKEFTPTDNVNEFILELSSRHTELRDYLASVSFCLPKFNQQNWTRVIDEL
jgi:hypothetical protein